ncbi:MAG TPA: DUF2793 domain-containing protein [Sphingomonas sp.]|nr:DUF2793 domain-containing protein [Sphingomonas sp.]
MSDEASVRLALPFLAAGQAQKEMTVNEALARLDVAVQAAAVAAGVDDPPAAPAPGQCWIVGSAPTAAWAGQAHALAAWTDDGWRFVAPVEGMAIWVAAEAVRWRWQGGSWMAGDLAGHRVSIDGIAVIGPQAAAIADPDGGAVIDAEACAAVGAILAALRSHGLIAA